jgi:hypothetical protein
MWTKRKFAASSWCRLPSGHFTLSWAATLYTSVLEALGSNLGRDIGYPDWFDDFSQSLDVNARIICQSGHDRVFLFPVQQLSYHSTVYSLDDASVIMQTARNHWTVSRRSIRTNRQVSPSYNDLSSWYLCKECINEGSGNRIVVSLWLESLTVERCCTWWEGGSHKSSWRKRA